MPGASAHWEHFEHGADVGIRGFGATKAQAFEQAALALTAVITPPQAVALRDTIEIRCQAPDDELLLVDWLNTLIYEMATRRMLFGAFTVNLNDHQLQAQARGEGISRRRHRPTVEVKGATLTLLAVRACPQGWLAQTIVDV